MLPFSNFSSLKVMFFELKKIFHSNELIVNMNTFRPLCICSKLTEHKLWRFFYYLGPVRAKNWWRRGFRILSVLLYIWRGDHKSRVDCELKVTNIVCSYPNMLKIRTNLFYDVLYRIQPRFNIRKTSIQNSVFPNTASFDLKNIASEIIIIHWQMIFLMVRVQLLSLFSVYQKVPFLYIVVQ
jgi:hypothetical protein